jgi:mono/diheme cytochrome c family protein
MAQAALLQAADSLKDHPDPELSRLATGAAQKAGPLRSKTAWLAVLTDAKTPGPERLVAWQHLSLKDELSPDTVRPLMLPAHPPALRAEARAWLMRRDPRAGAALAQEALASGTTLEKQRAVRTLDRLPGTANGNERFLLELTRQLGNGLVDRGIQVEVLEVLQRRDVESRSPWRKANEAWMASLTMQTDPLAGWRMTVSDGDPEAGRVLFETHPEARCQSCHAVSGQGGLAGPDLDGVATRLTPGLLLESLIHPSARLTPGYEPHAIPGAGGDAPPGKLSAMPPAGAILTLREIRDLMAWLQTLTDP